MKALFFTNEYPPYVYGGAGIHVEYLTRELARHMDVEVRCFGDQRFRRGRLAVRGAALAFERFKSCDPKIKTALSAFDNNLAFNAAPIAADLVHCHTWYTHMGGLLAQMAHAIPLVITTHSLEPLRPWKREQLGRGYDLSAWIEKTALERADGIVAVSHGMKEDVVRLFNVKENKVRVIYNGIDEKEFLPAPRPEVLLRLGINPDVPYLLFVGRITRQKGIIHLVNAIRHLDPRLQVVLFAGAPDTPQIKREMEGRVRAVQKRRPGVVWIQRWVDTPTKVALYSGASVFCCPSIYEPFGIINLEAMACGVPVVASAVGGIKEIVVHGQTGLLVPLKQQKASPFEALTPERFARDLAGAINDLFHDERLRHSMGRAARRRVEQIFSWRSIAQQTLAFYKTLV